MQNLPSQAELHELLDYDPLTGILLWRYRPQELGSWNSRYAGKPALASKNKRGYLYGSLSGSTVRAHRVIWKWLYGNEPDNIDHENGIRSDNRKINLRNGSVEQNQKNTKHRSDNSSGVMGVRKRLDTGKYQAFINHKRKQIPLGCFDTLEEAKAARKQGEIDYGYHPNHGRKL